MGLPAFVAATAAGVSTLTAVVSRAAARQEKAEAEAAIGELLARESLCQVALVGTRAVVPLVATIGAVNWWRQSRKCNELELSVQLRQLHVEVLRGRLENQERRSKDRFMRLEWARGAAQLRVDWLSQERDELRTRNGDLVRDRKAARVQFAEATRRLQALQGVAEEAKRAAAATRVVMHEARRGHQEARGHAACPSAS